MNFIDLSYIVNWLQNEERNTRERFTIQLIRRHSQRTDDEAAIDVSSATVRYVATKRVNFALHWNVGLLFLTIIPRCFNNKLWFREVHKVWEKPQLNMCW